MAHLVDVVISAPEFTVVDMFININRIASSIFIRVPPGTALGTNLSRLQSTAIWALTWSSTNRGSQLHSSALCSSAFALRSNIHVSPAPPHVSIHRICSVLVRSKVGQQDYVKDHCHEHYSYCMRRVIHLTSNDLLFIAWFPEYPFFCISSSNDLQAAILPSTAVWCRILSNSLEPIERLSFLFFNKEHNICCIGYTILVL